MKNSPLAPPFFTTILSSLGLLIAFTFPCRAQWAIIEDDLPIGVAESDPGVLNGKVYLFGGNITSDTVWVFDPMSGWSFGGIMPDSLEAVVVEEFNGKFYLFGGHSHPDFVYRTEVMTYDPATQVFDTVGQMPTAKAWFTSAVLGDKIYLIGGDNYVSGASNTVDIFDPVTGDWDVGQPMGVKRIAASADTLGGKIYVTGGTEGTVALNTVEIYDPATATNWQTSPALMNHGRGFHACKTFDGKLFAMGGTLSFTEPVSNSVEYFDPQLGEWVDFDTLNFARRKLGSAVLSGNALYVMGGRGAAGFIMEVEKYELLQPGQSCWQIQYPVSNPYLLQDLFFMNETTGWVVGDSGTILKTEDGGAIWQQQPSMTNINLKSAFFTDNLTGWVVGNEGAILHTSNGGESWVPQTSGITSALNAVYFTDNQTGWTGGESMLLKTTNGGESWQALLPGILDYAYSIQFIDDQTGWMIGAIAANNGVLKTTDGGESWELKLEYDSEGLIDVFFIDSQTGWAITHQFTVFKTTDGGENWEVLSQSINMGLAYSIRFIDYQTGWVGGTDTFNGKIFKTSDGGVSWETEWIDPTFGGGVPNVQFFTDQTGWAVGSTGILTFGEAPAPKAEFTWTAQGAVAQFTNTSTGAATFLWEFGDGSSSEEENPEHVYAASGEYVVKLTVANACGDTDTYEQTISVTTAVSDLEFFDVFTIQPNPASDFFRLHVEGKQVDHLVFDLIGMTGQKLLTETLSFQSGKIDKTISCKNFPKGLYLVRVATTQGMGVQKIVIQ